MVTMKKRLNRKKRIATAKQEDKLFCEDGKQFSDVTSGITPLKVSQIFRSANAGATREQSQFCKEILEKDWSMANAFHLRTAAPINLEYDIISADDSARAMQIADYVSDSLKKIKPRKESGLKDFRGLLQDMMTAVISGFAVNEIRWEIGGTNIEGFKFFDQSYFNFKDGTNWPQIETEEEDLLIDPNRFIVHDYLPRSGQVCRGGLIRPLGYIYVLLRQVTQAQLRYSEKFGMPFLAVTVPDDYYDPDEDGNLQVDDVQAFLENFGEDGSGILPEGVELDFKDGSSSDPAIFDRIIGFLSKKITQILIGQDSTVESENSNRSTALVHNMVRHDIICEDARNLESSINTQIVAKLVENTFGSDALSLAPSFRFNTAPIGDLSLVADLILKLKQSGYEMEDDQIQKMLGCKVTKIAVENEQV